MTSESQKKAVRKYDKDNTFSICVKLNIKTDADIIRHLVNEKNKNAYIKRLIRNDIWNNK